MNAAPRFYLITYAGKTRGKTLTLADGLFLLWCLSDGDATNVAFCRGWDIISPDGDSVAADYGLRA